MIKKLARLCRFSQLAEGLITAIFGVLQSHEALLDGELPRSILTMVFTPYPICKVNERR